MKIYKTNEFVEKLNINQIQIKDLNNIQVYNYYPKNYNELRSIIKKRIKDEGSNCDLNDIDVSEITNMSYLFGYSYFDTQNNIDFNGDISKWDVSNVISMDHMFYKSEFNGDISEWDVYNVKNMEAMFAESKFNQDISKWNVYDNVVYYKIFYNCQIDNYKKPTKFNN